LCLASLAFHFSSQPPNLSFLQRNGGSSTSKLLSLKLPFFIASQLLTTALFVIGLLPLAAALTDEWIAKRQFPVFSDFENPLEVYRWVGDSEFDIDNSISSHGTSSLKIWLNTSKYSGVALKYFPTDWQGYRALKFNVYNPSSEPLKITCRVHDRQHTRGREPELYDDRFNRTYLLNKGWAPITIDLEELADAPKNRRMDISQIQGVGVFVVQLPRTRVIYIDYIRLSK
jgi:hypothetical protein